VTGVPEPMFRALRASFSSTRGLLIGLILHLLKKDVWIMPYVASEGLPRRADIPRTPLKSGGKALMTMS